MVQEEAELGEVVIGAGRELPPEPGAALAGGQVQNAGQDPGAVRFEYPAGIAVGAGGAADEQPPVVVGPASGGLPISVGDEVVLLGVGFASWRRDGRRTIRSVNRRSGSPQAQSTSGP